MRAVVILSLTSALSFGLAAFILRVSNAHGHGLASGDRSSVIVLVATGVLCAGGAIWGFRKRRR
ncbi:MAG: LPXTG cell wall anchor domain-containing protein [Gemmatimonadota bacterium]|nr:LPXTG cell wall anchor domain-containing protein [Gemmatimonadota bacterium]MDH3424104.1 LPXTG cell wall anchor domain-containing protein [Gemmatimonadota bacterium]